VESFKVIFRKISLRVQFFRTDHAYDRAPCCKAKSVVYVRRRKDDEDQVFGSEQWYDHDPDTMYYATYSLPESLEKINNPYRTVSCRIFKHNRQTDTTERIWAGPFTDYLHDILVNRTGRYCVVCELGMFVDSSENIIPSKVLMIDMQNNRQWVISRFIVAAHACFDPEDPDVIYFSNHNFRFVSSSYTSLLRNATYALKFNGPASVYKYRLTPDGPQEIGVFTDPGMFRLTNSHVFIHRGRKILAAMGFPNFVYIADAETLTFIKRIEITSGRPIEHGRKDVSCSVGTISPSLDGEKLYVQTTGSFQIIDIDQGSPDHILPLFFNHSSANHMATFNDTDW
jgi:hypothetical protein